MQHTENKRKNAILKHISHFPRGHATALAVLGLCLAIFTILPSDTASANFQSRDLEIPVLQHIDENLHQDTLAYTDSYLSDNDTNTRKVNEQVRPGDTLSGIFKRAGLSDRHMMELLQSSADGKRLAKLYPGHSLNFVIDEEGSIESLEYVIDRLNSYSFSRTLAGYAYSEHQRAPDMKYALRSATIEDSLFNAGKKAQLEDRLVMELANIFGWDIDFALDIRVGDSFRILYEESFLDGEKIGSGNILAAEFTNKSSTYKAVRYVNEDGVAQYYTPSGDTMRKEFLRTPIDFARISSHFNLRRKHPVLNKIRAHKGTDYAASHGTPIKATGDGKVTFAGRKGGYGNVVIVQHGQTYKTLYAHISKFRKGIRKGVRVKQGQVIAYVGSTGLATGPHLHYEFYVNGAVRNPVRVQLPKAQSIAKSELPRFLQQTQALMAELDPANVKPTRLAANNSDNPVKQL